VFVTLETTGSSFKLSQPGAPATTGTTAESKTTHIPYQPRVAAYPYAIGGWGYHYPTFPSATAPSSVTPGATQGDSVTNILASGTFPYPYTAVQYSTGQSAYVPPVKYPYGAPALPTASTSDAGTTTSPSAAQPEEWNYNDIQWKRPYTGPCAPSAAESQVQNESAPSAEGNELKQSADGADSVESSTNDVNNSAPFAEDPAPTSSTTGVTFEIA
jgi:hypothetical protein